MKNKFYILFLIILISGIFSCNQNNSTKEQPGPALFPQPKSFALNTKEGYKINPLTGDSIKPIVNSQGDTVKTGVKIPANGKMIHPDSVAQPIVIKAGNGKVHHAHSNRHLIPENSMEVTVDESKLKRIIVPEIEMHDTAHYIFNMDGKKVKTGVKIPVRGKKVRMTQPKSRTALPFRMKDNATCDIQYLDVDQGMNSSYIRSILEDRNGNLWMGTYGGGVSKYDGVNFIHYTESNGLSNNIILSMLEDRKGNLWFATNGGGVSKYDGESFTHFTEAEGLSYNSVLSMIEDRNGNLWFGTSGGGVCKFDGKNFVHYTDKEGLSNNVIMSMCEDRMGNIWMGTYGGGVNKFDGKSFTHYTDEVGLSKSIVLSIFEDSKGNIWFGTVRGGVCKFDGKKIHYYTENEGLSSNIVLSILEDSRGNLWFGTSEGGVNKFNGKSFVQYSEKDGFSHNIILSIIEDRKGNLWFGTNGGGICKFNVGSFIHMTESEGLNNKNSMSILEDSQGNLWVGTVGGGVAKLVFNGLEGHDTLSFVYYTKSEGLNENNIWSLLEDSKGNIWMGTYNGGVCKFDGENFIHYTINEGLSNNTVQSILEDRKGNLWFGTNGGGVCKFNGEYFVHYTEREGLGSNVVLSMLEDRSGNLWFGTRGGGVSKLILNDRKGNDEEFFVHYTEREGLCNNTVRSIHEDSNGDLWFSSEGGGISKLVSEKSEGNEEARFMHFTENEGLSHNTIWSMLEDDKGNIWISTDRGINEIISRKSHDLKEAQNSKKRRETLSADYYIQVLTKPDGLKPLDFYYNSAIIDSRNRAWWGSGKGLSMLDLNKYEINSKPPEIVLRQIDINENFIDYRNMPDSIRDEIVFDGIHRFENYPLNLEIPHYKNHLTFHFAAIDWAAPHKIKYQYKLEGINENWSTVTDEAKADFRNLPYGTYTFKVRAIGESQVWSKPVEYTFTIHPPWWHTTWFRVFYVSGFVMLLYLLYRWRTASLRKQKEILEKTVEIRTKEVVEEKKQVEVQKHLVEEKQKEIIDSINYAQRLQKAILAPESEIKRYFPDSFLLYKPKDIVAGDFYFFEATETHVFYAAADCTGHGVPGAMVSIVCSNALTRCVKEFNLTDPGLILDKTRELILETFKKSGQDVKDGMDISFVSIAYGMKNGNERELKSIAWSGANNPLWYIENGEMKETKADKQPIGKSDHPRPFATHSLPLSLSALFLFTDGYADQFGGPKGKKFKYSNLQQLLIGQAKSKPDSIKVILEQTFNDWKGDLEQVDDVCIIGIRI